MIGDQFGFQVTGSTTCALAVILHQVTAMLENCKCVQSSLIFQKHLMLLITVLLCKLSHLDLPHCILNWLISFLADHSQVVKCGDILSLPMHINSGIIQGSGVSPTFILLWRVICDMRTLFSVTTFFAADTNLIVPGNSDIGLHDEFSHICNRAKANKIKKLRINKRSFKYWKIYNLFFLLNASVNRSAILLSCQS